MACNRVQADDDPEWQPAEANWDFHRSDLKASRMIIQRQRPVINFEIPILPQAPSYDPTSAPVSAPIDLQLDNDAHIDENQRAFIVDKVILPLEPFTDINDPRQRRAYYIIGWPDLPSARPVVDCANASKYVSPHAIEEWEYQSFLRREEEKEAAETEAAIAAVAAAIAAEKWKGIAGDDPRILPNGKREPGRKPKNARLLDARAPTPQLDSEQEEILAKRKKGPSLSTPQNSRIAQLDAELERDLLEAVDDSVDDAGDMDELLQQQMGREARSEVADSMDEDDYDIDPLGPNTAVSGSPSLSRASNAGPTMLRDEPQNFGSFLVSSRPPASKNVRQDLLGSASGSKSTKPLALPPSQRQHQPDILQRPSMPVPMSGVVQSTVRLSTTPIPVPQRPSWPSKSKVSSSPAQTVLPSIEKGTPGHGRNQATKHANSATNSQPQMPQKSSSLRPSSSNGTSGFTPTNNFTPVGGYVPRHPKRSAEGRESTPSSARGSSERKRKAPKLSQPPPRAAA